jgi:hypothetical protein
MIDGIIDVTAYTFDRNLYPGHYARLSFVTMRVAKHSNRPTRIVQALLVIVAVTWAFTISKQDISQTQILSSTGENKFSHA